MLNSYMGKVGFSTLIQEILYISDQESFFWVQYMSQKYICDLVKKVMIPQKNPKLPHLIHFISILFLFFLKNLRREPASLIHLRSKSTIAKHLPYFLPSSVIMTQLLPLCKLQFFFSSFWIVVPHLITSSYLVFRRKGKIKIVQFLIFSLFDFIFFIMIFVWFISCSKILMENM